MRDPYRVELVSDARRVLATGAGDCDELVVLLCSLCAVTGINTRFVAIGPEPDEFTHVYCEAELDDDIWLALDPTNPEAEPGWSVPPVAQYAWRLEVPIF